MQFLDRLFLSFGSNMTYESTIFGSPVSFIWLEHDVRVDNNMVQPDSKHKVKVLGDPNKMHFSDRHSSFSGEQ